MAILFRQQIKRGIKKENDPKQQSIIQSLSFLSIQEQKIALIQLLCLI